EAVPVAAAIDFVDDRGVEVPAPQEVRMEGVHDAPLHRTRGCRERLAQHLTAEDLRTPDVAALAAKQVHLELFELEVLDQVGGLSGHAWRSRKDRDQPMVSVPFISAL